MTQKGTSLQVLKNLRKNPQVEILDILEISKWFSGRKRPMVFQKVRSTATCPKNFQLGRVIREKSWVPAFQKIQLSTDFFFYCKVWSLFGDYFVFIIIFLEKLFFPKNATFTVHKNCFCDKKSKQLYYKLSKKKKNFLKRF